MKNPALPIALVAVVFLSCGVGASSATTFSLTEAFGTLGALSTPWVSSGVPSAPQVVAGVGSDTPANALRLTSIATDSSGFVLYDQAIPIDSGIDVSFHQAQFGGGGNGADGIAFFVKDGADTSTAPGGVGGSLGYSIGRPTGPFGYSIGRPNSLPVTDGISGALVGVGLDGYGNFDDVNSDGVTGCDPRAFIRYSGSNAISVRGPGQGTAGYCLLADTVSLNNIGLSPLTSPAYRTRAAADRVFRVVIDPATSTNAKIYVYYGLTESTLTKVIEVALPSAFSSVTAVKIGFAGGTGGLVDNHDVWGLTTKAVAAAAPTHSQSLAATGPNQGSVIATALGALLLLIAGVITARRRPGHIR